MSLNDRKKTFRDIFLTESISPIYPRFVVDRQCREGKTLGKTPEIVSRRRFRPPVGGSKVAERVQLRHIITEGLPSLSIIKRYYGFKDQMCTNGKTCTVF